MDHRMGRLSWIMRWAQCNHRVFIRGREGDVMAETDWGDNSCAWKGTRNQGLWAAAWSPKVLRFSILSSHRVFPVYFCKSLWAETTAQQLLLPEGSSLGLSPRETMCCHLQNNKSLSWGSDRKHKVQSLSMCTLKDFDSTSLETELIKTHFNCKTLGTLFNIF